MEFSLSDTVYRIYHAVVDFACAVNVAIHGVCVWIEF